MSPAATWRPNPRRRLWVTVPGKKMYYPPRESRLGILSPQHEPQFSIETYAAIREFINDADQCQTALGVPLWA